MTVGRRLWLALLIAVFLSAPVRGVLFLRKYVAESFRIPSGAMTPTLIPGESVIALKSDSARAPARGAVRVFRYPADPTKDFVSRVVAVAGDRVRVLPDGSIERNGAALPRCALGPWPAATAGEPARDAFMEVDGAQRYVVLQHREREAPTGDHCVAEACTVPAGHALTVGDNRDDSYDGRYWGFVPTGNFTAAPRWIFRAAPGSGREGADAQAAPVLPSPLRRAWAECLARLP